MINESVIVVVAKEGSQGDFATFTNSGIISINSNNNAVIDINRIFSTERSTSVCIRNLNCEDVGIGAIRKIDDLSHD